MSARALHSSPIPANSTSDRRGMVGAAAMGYHPMPVQRQIWHLLDARTPKGHPLYPAAVVEVPRRAGKTDALMALLVGRCYTTPGYRAIACAQTGIKSRARFMDLVRSLGRGAKGGWRPYRARGEEAINFENGSTLSFYPPLAASFRGDAADVILLDEAQETDPEAAADLLGSAMPVFDTRPQAQLWVAGTAGPTRDGLLWEALELGRAHKWGILEYAAPPGLDPDDPAGWLTVHPGPAGVTRERALEVLRMRHAQMDPVAFAREYLGIWPELTRTSAFPAATWAAAGVDTPPARPPRYGLAFDVSPDGGHATVTAAWRAGVTVWGGVLEDRDGLDWVAPYVAALAIRDRLPVWHDSTPWNNAVAADITRTHRNRVTVHATTTHEYARACAMLAGEVMAGTFRHSRQLALDDAVTVASKRPFGDGGWGWGRRASTGHITALVALSISLLTFDQLPAQRITKALSAQTR